MDQIVLWVELAAPIATSAFAIGREPISGQALSYPEDQVERCCERMGRYRPSSSSETASSPKAASGGAASGPTHPEL